jgi:hypothetical protein
MRRVDLTNRHIDRLIVLRPAITRQGTTQNKTRWQVLCYCGDTFECDTADLTRTDGKRRANCGAVKHKQGRESAAWLSPNEISMTYWNSLIAAAKRRGKGFDITIEYANAIFTGYCALSGEPIVLGANASLDRIDSSKGYYEGNVQWVSVAINKLKSDFDEAWFIELCRRVAKHNDR